MTSPPTEAACGAALWSVGPVVSTHRHSMLARARGFHPSARKTEQVGFLFRFWTSRPNVEPHRHIAGTHWLAHFSAAHKKVPATKKSEVMCGNNQTDPVPSSDSALFKGAHYRSQAGIL